MCRATVGQIVAINGSQNNILQFEVFDRSCNISRFLRIKGTVRPTVLHVTESASACTELTHYHESRCAAAPALANVRAVGFLAYRV
jgi:hypothetical protein